MSDTRSEIRLAENEAVFRKLNEEVNSGFDETNRLALEDKQPEFMVSPNSFDKSIHFLCECSDEKCIDRITIKLGEYRKIHKNRNYFMIVPGHEVTTF
jgi:hypothetical protein